MPEQPCLPITNVLPDRDGKFLVFSYSYLYRVDPGLGAWSKAFTLEIHHLPSRQDAFGLEPSIVAVHRLGERLVCATAVDGFVEVVADEDVGLEAFRHALSGQIGFDGFQRIVVPADGALFLPWNPAEPPWRLNPSGWEAAAIAPPVEEEEPWWDETYVMVGPGGTIYTVSGGERGKSPRATARRVGGRWEILGRETSDLNVASCFITPDGALWNAGRGKLLRFAEGAWVDVAALPNPEPEAPRGEPEEPAIVPEGKKADRVIGQSPKSFKIGWGLQALGDAGPPWLLMDDDESQLLRLADGPGLDAPKLDAVKVVEDAEPLKVFGAIQWSKGELLLATDKGLRRFDVATDEVRREGLPAPDGSVSSLARDGLGRVWLGGEGLWLMEGNGEGLRDLRPLPMIGRSAVATMAADPKHRDGVILSLGPRGVVYVQATPGP